MGVRRRMDGGYADLGGQFRHRRGDMKADPAQCHN